MPAAKIQESVQTSGLAWQGFRAQKEFGSLGGLRCLSILAVIWHHGPGLTMPGLTQKGYLGVSLFFAISGFLITTLLLREQDRTGTISLPAFYVRRSLRIFPLYFGLLAVYYVLVRIFAHGKPEEGVFNGNIIYFVTYTYNWFGAPGTFGFSWSLAAEEQFYSTWPWVVRFWRPLPAIGLMAVLIAVVAVINPSGAQQVPGAFWFTILSSVPLAICWGSLSAFLLHSERSFPLAWRLLGNYWTPAPIFILILIALSVTPLRLTLVSFLFSALVVSCVIREKHVLAPVLNHPWIAFIGTISYGMYMLHGLTYDLLGRFPIPGMSAHGIGGFFAALALTILLATLSFKFYESPFLRLKKRFGGRRESLRHSLNTDAISTDR